MGKRHLVAALIVLSIGAVAVLWELRGARCYGQVAPERARVWSSWQAGWSLGDAVKCRRGNEVFYIVNGATPPGYILASSAPVYVFGADGSLLEWVDDPGDRPSAMDKWQAPISEPVEFGERSERGQTGSRLVTQEQVPWSVPATSLLQGLAVAVIRVNRTSIRVQLPSAGWRRGRDRGGGRCGPGARASRGRRPRPSRSCRLCRGRSRTSRGTASGVRLGMTTFAPRWRPSSRASSPPIVASAVVLGMLASGQTRRVSATTL